MISNPLNAKIAVLSVDGRMVYMSDNSTSQNSVEVNAPGVYIVAVGKELHKVMVK